MKRENRKKRKKKIVRIRHRYIYAFLRIVLWPFFAWRYHFKYGKYRLRKDGPYLILGNHTCMVDPILLSFSFDFQIYFISSEQIFNLGFITKILKFLVRPISKTKSMADVGTIKNIKKVLSQGGSIGMFVEGNTSYNGVNPSTPYAIGKLIKHMKVPVIFYTTHGLYFQDPRWSKYRKTGKSWGGIERILFPSQYANMTDEEVYQIVVDELHVNAYEDQAKSGYLYSGKNRAEGLERFLFACPVCHEFNSLQTHQHELECMKCGSKATYLESGRLKSDNFPFETLIEWDDYQKEALVNYLENVPPGLIYEDDALLWNSSVYPKRKVGNCHFALTTEGIEITQDGKTKKYDYQDVFQLSIQGKHKLILYLLEGQTWLLDFEGSFNPYQYLLTFQYYKYKIEHKGENHENISKFLGL